MTTLSEDGVETICGHFCRNLSREKLTKQLSSLEDVCDGNHASDALCWNLTTAAGSWLIAAQRRLSFVALESCYVNYCEFFSRNTSLVLGQKTPFLPTKTYFVLWRILSAKTLFWHCKKLTVVDITSTILDYKRWARSWTRFLGSQPAGDLVINTAECCHYFPEGLQLPSRSKSITVPWPVPNYTAWWQRHTGVSSLRKASTQWCPARTRARDLWIASPLPCQ